MRFEASCLIFLPACHDRFAGRLSREWQWPFSGSTTEASRFDREAAMSLVARAACAPRQEKVNNA